MHFNQVEKKGWDDIRKVNLLMDIMDEIATTKKVRFYDRKFETKTDKLDDKQ